MTPRFADVSFRYPTGAGVTDINFDIEPNRPLALLGRNGAGKSTILRLLVGALTPSRGTVEGVRGLRLGYLPEDRGLYPQLSVEAHLAHFARIGGVKAVRPAVEEWLTRLDLSDRRRSPARTLSKGNAQKLQIGICLICDPQLLVMDEPFSGLDPDNRIMLGRILKGIAPTTHIVVSGHNIAYMEGICRDALIVRDGTVAAAGEIARLRREMCQPVLRLEGQPVPLPPDGGISAALDSLTGAVDRGFAGEFSYTLPTLEEMFVSIIDQERGEAGDVIRVH
jgi:ABC-2 type transport system ATP-binding protein